MLTTGLHDLLTVYRTFLILCYSMKFYQIFPGIYFDLFLEAKHICCAMSKFMDSFKVEVNWGAAASLAQIDDEWRRLSDEWRF